MATRRTAICLIAIGISAIASIGSASALDYPTRPVRWIVGYPPGGATDIIARLIGQRLSERLGQQFVIENKPGAGNNIATEAAINAEPDGYTVLLVNPANYINATLYTNLKFNFVRDIAPVAAFNRVPNVMTVSNDVPAKTVAEFIAYVKANPGKVNMASSGNGTSVHLSGEMFMMMSGTKMQHVPYRGAAPAITDMLGGQVQLIFDNMPSIIQHVRAGSLRALAVTTTARSPQLPDRCRHRAGLRGERAVRHGRAEEHAEGNHREAEQGDQRGAGGAWDQGEAGRPRRRAADRFAR
jgi:tripartite-type tricarboxylate transporter receptor subunit TctC